MTRGGAGRARRAVVLAVAAAGLIATSCSRTVLSPAGPLTSPVPADFGLSPFTVVVTEGSSGEEHYGQTSLTWLVSRKVEITVRNVSSQAADAVLEATLKTPPCGGPVRVDMTPPKQRSTEFAVAAGSGEISLPLQIAQGTTTTIHVVVTTPSCKIAGDWRTFYAGLVDLSAVPAADG